MVASKLILILDDLLWVLTDSQLKAMVQYAKSLSEAMEKSAQQRKSMATDEQVHMYSLNYFDNFSHMQRTLHIVYIHINFILTLYSRKRFIPFLFPF